MSAAAPPRLVWLLLLLATGALLAAGLLLPIDPAGWRFGLTVIGALAGGSILMALVGRLLSREWLAMVEDELLPAGAGLALVAVLAVPLLDTPAIDTAALFGEALTPQRRFWFAEPAMLARLALFLAAGVGLSLRMALAQGGRYRIAAFGLPVLTALFALAVADWVMVRPPIWWTALLPIGFVVNQLTAALAIAFLYHLVQRERADEAAFASLAAALFSLALLDIWIGYVQLLVAWYGNLPEGAAWYLERQQAAPGLLPIAALLQAAGALLLLWRRTQPMMLLAAALLLGAYAANAVWLAGDMLPGTAMGWAGAVLVIALWAAWVAAMARWHDARIAPRRPRSP